MASEVGIVVLTLQVAVAGTALNIPFAVMISWLVVKKKMRGLFVLDILASLPLALPPVVVGYFLLLLLGREGPIGVLFNLIFGADIVFTWVACVLASAVVSFPLMVRSMMISIGGVENRLEISARILGAGAIRSFCTVTLPLAYRGMLAGVLLGFIRALSEFGATIIVAGNIPGRTQTISMATFDSILLGKEDVAFRLVTVSVVLAVTTLLIHNWLISKSEEHEVINR